MPTRRDVLILGLALAASGVGVASADAVTFVLKIENGRVPRNLRLIRVKQGDTVKLQWSTDRRTNLHLHGYDIEKEVVPGTVAEMSFDARATGRFTVAPHVGKQAGGGHSHGDALVTIEVHPR
jgi:FtsP/CotA-like multicopper oxidase with cupredoxin domain